MRSSATSIKSVRLHPVWMCGLRPFFIFTAASAILLMLGWLASLMGWPLAGGLAMMPGGAMLWHAHEMVFGFGGAAIAGFVLTAVPEFTDTKPLSSAALKRLVVVWMAARITYLLAAWWPSIAGLWPAALFNLLLWLGLLRHTVPAVWADPQRRHVSFGWILIAMAVLQAGFFVSVQIGNPFAWLHAAVGAMMVLIVVAASRISMSVINRRVEAGRPGSGTLREPVYVARPPRRKLAVFTIVLCSGLEFFLGYNAITGWAALAAAAAMLNLLNDWHVGRPLLSRWALMLYTSYWMLALGYAVMGLAWLGAPVTAAAGRHVLMVGAMALSVFTVMNIAGRIHAGLWLDRRAWVPVAAAMLVMTALLRLAAGVGPFAMHAPLLWLLSGLLWVAVFLNYLCYALPALAGPRTDGRYGCQGPGPTAD